MNNDPNHSYADDLTSVLVETTHSRCLHPGPFLDNVLPGGDLPNTAPIGVTQDPASYSLIRLSGGSQMNSETMSQLSDSSSSHEDVLDIGPTSMSSRLAQAQMADSLSYALVAGEFLLVSRQKRKRVASI